MNLFNEPHRINRFIELDHISKSSYTKHSTAKRLKRIRREINAAVNSIIPKDGYTTRLNR